MIVENAYLAMSPGRYVFPGAELFYDPDDEEDSDSDTSSESSDSSGIAGDENSMPVPEQGFKRKATD